MKNDEEKIGQAVDLIYELINLNPSIKSKIWAASILCVLVMGYKKSGFSYTNFRKEMIKSIDHYKDWWSED
jgi:hypothetical protein